MNREQYKVIFLGDTNVGKTSLINMKILRKFDTDVPTTIGASFKNINVQYKDSLINLQIWDTAGQERYKSITRPYYRHADAAFVVFDLSNPKTLSNIPYWLNELSQQQENCVLVLVGNKSDLEHKVTPSMITELMCSFKINKYIETSAKKGQSIDYLFQNVAELLHESKHIQTNTNTHQNFLKIQAGIELNRKEYGEVKGCC